jgi:hypothetical protein
MDDIEILRQALAEEQRLRKEAESRLPDEQRRRGEEQRRREEAEEISRTSQPQTLEHYLEICHSLSLTIHVFADRSLTTQGDTTNPAGRFYPRRIVPWRDFPVMQEEI